MAAYKRKRYLVKKAFQLRYTAVILAFVVLTSLISCAAIYLTIFPYLSEKLANVYPQARLTFVLRSANLKAFVSALLLLPIASWIAVILSHRVAGPWYRLENILRGMARGNLTAGIKLRRGDELQSLADALNEVTTNLKNMRDEHSQAIKSIKDAVGELNSEVSREAPDPIKVRLLSSKIEVISNDLSGLLTKYKLGA